MSLAQSIRSHKLRWSIATLFLLLLLLTILSMLLPLTVTYYTVYSSNLPPAFDGFKILQVSDLQNSTNKDILRRAQEIRPDIIVFTGDNLYHNPSEVTLAFAFNLVRELAEIAPVYAVSGNHDLWNPDFEQNRQLLEEAGAVHLENAATVIEKDGDTIHLMGITDPDTFDAEESKRVVTEYLAEVQATDGYDILLFHRANMLDLFDGLGFELILSGHNHGGQIRLPLLGGIMTPQGEYFSKYNEGMHQLDEATTAVISRGIGNTVRIPRVNNPPELVVVTLKRDA